MTPDLMKRGAELRDEYVRHHPPKLASGGASYGRLVQPGIKCRGREYLRIIYGPEYTRPDNLDRLRKRFLNHKRSLAIR